MITNAITAIITAYVATGQPCANGRMPSLDHTIAAPRWIPLGSIVIIEGRRYVVEDRTNIRYNGRYDLFMSNHQTALQWGKQCLTITVITP